MALICSSDNYSPHRFGSTFYAGPPRRARSFLVLSRLGACAAMGTMILLAIALCSTIASAQQKTPDETPSGVVDLSLEELMNVNIYTASKRWQKIVEAPASISIVTADEIQRYGYRTLAEILGSMPGIYIRYDRNYSYIGVRGFSRPG